MRPHRQNWLQDGLEDQNSRKFEIGDQNVDFQNKGMKTPFFF